MKALNSGICLGFVCLLNPLLAGAGALTPEEQRGRQIFVDGTSPSGGEITAVMSNEGIEVPASAVPCAGCHGRDGRGRPEGGVAPSDLTWEVLTRQGGVTHPSGRHHPPYDERLFKRAVTMGLDPAGNPLHVAMPRFRLSLQDMADLTAYIKRLGTASDPGVTGTAVRIGLVLPPPGPLTAMGRTVQAALAARFEEWNAKGGIYGRRLDLVPFEPPADQAARRTAVADFLVKSGTFANLGAFLLGDDTALATLFEKSEMPLIAPFTVHPRETFPLQRDVFYLLPGIETQGVALVRALRAAAWAHPSAPAIVAPDDAGLDDAVSAVARACGAWAPAQTVRYGRSGFDPAPLAHRLVGADPVVFLGAGPEALALLRAADAIGWHPVFAATAAAGDGALRQAPKSFAGRLWLALPAAPNEVSAQLTALAGAEILGEALRRAGRDLTRDRLIEQMESLRGFETGYAPPVTY
ncbi:MAG TPA: ABC transporter substrate-binding protein, partial [Thermoanaerobaculia bacterium]|nr:ABC transporter substrate-binding protein [Thermoanaerobaculia bacterium]